MSAEVDGFLVHYGVKGMKWGKRKTPGDIQRAKQKKEKKERDSAKYTNEEIKAARGRQKIRADAYQKAVDKAKYNPKTKKLIFSDEMARTNYDWSTTKDRYVANRKTTGEKFVATAIFGVAGAYATSDRRTTSRLAKEDPTKYKRMSSYERVEN